MDVDIGHKKFFPKEIPYAGDDVYIRFDVNDTGVGIKKQYQNYLFELFGVTKVNRNKKNAGLGLTISKILTTELGESLKINSILDQGTNVSFKVKSVSDTNTKTGRSFM